MRREQVTSNSDGKLGGLLSVLSVTMAAVPLTKRASSFEEGETNDKCTLMSLVTVKVRGTGMGIASTAKYFPHRGEIRLLTPNSQG